MEPRKRKFSTEPKVMVSTYTEITSSNTLGLHVSSSDHRLYVSRLRRHDIEVFNLERDERSIIIGAGVRGFKNGPIRESQFNCPDGIVTTDDNQIFVADSDNSLIRKIENGMVSTFAERYNLFSPTGLAWDSKSKAFFFTDFVGCAIYRITSDSFSLFAGVTKKAGHTDGLGANALFSSPSGICLGKDGTLYICDEGNHAIRQIDSHGMVTTLCGGKEGFRDGLIGQSLWNSPSGIAFDGDDTLFVADTKNRRVRSICLSAGSVHTVAGDGTRSVRDGIASSASFDNPNAIAFDRGTVYVADNNLIRQIKFPIKEDPNRIEDWSTTEFLDELEDFVARKRTAQVKHDVKIDELIRVNKDHSLKTQQLESQVATMERDISVLRTGEGIGKLGDDELKLLIANQEKIISMAKQRRFDIELLKKNEKSVECKVCMDKEVNTVLMDCAHVCVCSNCAANISHCPFCRSPVVRFITTFKM